MDIRISNLLLTFVLCSISIISFTESMNNDTSNIIILLPSYHCIIHKVKPTSDRKHLKFCFPNGFVEKVKIDKHLRQKMMLA